jgi:hypothetical protein
MQAQREPGLSERALRRVAELVADTELTVVKATGSQQPQRRLAHRRRLPIAGTTLTRSYKGRTLEVKVLDAGFEYEGQFFGTLSGLARQITGSHWNGYVFFGLASRRTAQS